MQPSTDSCCLLVCWCAADYSQAPDIYYSSMDARMVINGIRDEVRQVADGYLLGECWA
jgi:hypothetical protein